MMTQPADKSNSVIAAAVLLYIMMAMWLNVGYIPIYPIYSIIFLFNNYKLIEIYLINTVRKWEIFRKGRLFEIVSRLYIEEWRWLDTR